MDPFQYQQQQQLQYQQQYGQQQVQFVPAFPFNVQAQTAASGQYGGTFSAFPQQPIVGLYPGVVADTQLSQSQGQPQVFTPTAFAGQGHIAQTFQAPFAGYQFQQQPPANSQNVADTSSLSVPSSTSFAPPPINFTSMSVPTSNSSQASLNDLNQKYTEQYQKWQQQYMEWQAQHANHPDQKLFQEYQNQVQQWQQQQQQVLLQSQGVNFNQQLQAPQATPTPTVQVHSQPLQDPSTNLPSAVSQNMVMNQQFPSMQFQSSTTFPNEGLEMNKNDKQNSTHDFTNSLKYLERNTSQYEMSHDNKIVGHNQWQQGQQQLQLQNQHGQQDAKTSTTPNQVSQHYHQQQQQQQQLLNQYGQQDPKTVMKSSQAPQQHQQQQQQYQLHNQHGQQDPNTTMLSNQASKHDQQQQQQHQQLHNQYGQQDPKLGVNQAPQHHQQQQQNQLRNQYGQQDPKLGMNQAPQHHQQQQQNQLRNQYGQQDPKPGMPSNQALQHHQQQQQNQLRNQYGQQDPKTGMPSNQAPQHHQQQQQNQLCNQYGQQDPKPSMNQAPQHHQQQQQNQLRNQYGQQDPKPSMKQAPQHHQQQQQNQLRNQYGQQDPKPSMNQAPQHHQQQQQNQLRNQYGQQDPKPSMKQAPQHHQQQQQNQLRNQYGQQGPKTGMPANQVSQQQQQNQPHNQYGRQDPKTGMPSNQASQRQQQQQNQLHNRYGQQDPKTSMPSNQASQQKQQQQNQLHNRHGQQDPKTSMPSNQVSQQQQQNQLRNQYGRQDPKTSMPSNQVSQQKQQQRQNQLLNQHGQQDPKTGMTSNQASQQQQQNQLHNQYGQQGPKTGMTSNQASQQQQQNQLRNQYGRQDPKTSMPYNQTSQASTARPKSEFSKNNSVQGGLKKDIKPLTPLPKWMQAQGNQPQKVDNKTTEVKSSLPKWLQGDNKVITTTKEDAKPLPKWLQESNPVKTEQQGSQVEVKIKQQNKQGGEPVKEKLPEKPVTDTKPLPKWLQDTKPKTTTSQSSTTTQSVVTQQAKSSQAPPSTSAVSTVTTAFTGICVQKLDPKQELELLQKQSLQLLQLAQLEKKQKESKSEANQNALQKNTNTERKSDISKNQPMAGDNKVMQGAPTKEPSVTPTPSEHPKQDVTQKETAEQPSTNEKSKDNTEKSKFTKTNVSKIKSVPCRFFPNCRNGAECKFLHPPCTMGKSCTSKDCIFDHSNLPDPPPESDFVKESSLESLGKQDVKIPGIGEDSNYAKPAVDTEQRPSSGLQESTSVPDKDKNNSPSKQVQDDINRYPEERRGGELDGWHDNREWQRWRDEQDRSYIGRDERPMPPREPPPPHWDERERPYPQMREEWERNERSRSWRDWERLPERFDERVRWGPPRDEEYRRYEKERWPQGPPMDDWDYPPYRQDPSRPPLSPRFKRDPEFDRGRSPPREMREREYFDREFRNEPPYQRHYEEDRYGRPLSSHPDHYDRWREWEDREREYHRPTSREPDYRDWRGPPFIDRPSERYDYGRQERGRSPPMDPSRPPVYDRDQRYRDYPPDYDRREGYRDRKDLDRDQDFRYGGRPEWRRDPGAPHEDLGYRDHPHAREPVQPEKPKAVVVPVETILDKPGRDSRPDRIVIIMRGLPGSGKTHVARLVKDKEAANGAHAPRIISLDDYFLTEVEKQEKDPDTGKRVKKKVTEYLFEAEMEDAYRASMFKSFSKTLEDGFFPVVMVDAINNKVEHFEKYWSLAKQKGFEVYIAELSADTHVCAKRNSHNRTFEEISKIQSEWEESPTHMLRLDVRSLLQDAVITEVEMETADEATGSDLPKDSDKPENKEDNQEEDEDVPKSGIQLPQRSKWDDMDSSAEAQLNKLDGIRPLKRRREASPPLTLSDDEDPYDEKEEDMRIGKKRVRWADIEERKHMEHRRRIGFCIGTDWSLLTDPNAKIPEH